VIDEELLKPSREMIANLTAKIKQHEADTALNIRHWGRDDKEYAKEKWRQHYAAVEPMRREIEAISKVMADYYGLQAAPPKIINSVVK
jgi:hypothetical protein